MSSKYRKACTIDFQGWVRSPGPEGFRREATYDVLNRLAQDKVQRAPGTMIQMDYRYDDLGNLTSRFHAPGYPTGPEWTYAYDEGNRVKTATTPLASTAIRRSNAVGEPVYEQDEDGNETTREYDARGRLMKTTWRKPGGALWEEETRTYDPLGNVLSVEGFVSGVRVEYTYAPDAPEPDPHIPGPT